MNEKDINRFWSKVNKKQLDECWEWIAGKNNEGYGLFTFGGKTYRAHRIAYFLMDENISKNENLNILHACDNRACCNPKHLHPGTQGQNNRERAERRRSAPRHGENNANARLSKKDVKNIRELYKSGKLDKPILAYMYGVTVSHITQIINHTRWANS